MSNWNSRFLQLAALVASWSKDPDRKVGAIIIDTDRRIVGIGYNGFPRRVRDLRGRYANKELKNKMVVHAEVNAILNSVQSVRGAHLYSTFFPCPTCAGFIIQSGIVTVVAKKTASSREWKEKHKVSKTMFDEAGVRYGLV